MRVALMQSELLQWLQPCSMYVLAWISCNPQHSVAWTRCPWPHAGWWGSHNSSATMLAGDDSTGDGGKSLQSAGQRAARLRPTSGCRYSTKAKPLVSLVVSSAGIQSPPAGSQLRCHWSHGTMTDSSRRSTWLRHSLPSCASTRRQPERQAVQESNMAQAQLAIICVHCGATGATTCAGKQHCTATACPHSPPVQGGHCRGPGGTVCA